MRKAPSITVSVRAYVQRDELLGVWIGQRLQQHATGNGEHNGCCARTQGQRQYGDGGKGRVLCESAQRMADILEEGIHGFTVIRSGAPPWGPHW